jgi:hypothetical protein
MHVPVDGEADLDDHRMCLPPSLCLTNTALESGIRYGSTRQLAAVAACYLVSSRPRCFLRYKVAVMACAVKDQQRCVHGMHSEAPLPAVHVSVAADINCIP